MARPNNIVTSFSFNSLSRLTSVLHQLSGSTIDGAAYSLDNAGNRTAKLDELAGVTSSYSYDALYELTQVTQGTNTTESYSYDPVGNRLSSLGLASYTNNSSNELSSTPSTSYAYDYDGNTTSKTDSNGTTTYGWDYENRLASVTLPNSGGIVTFKYDPFGRRIYKQSPNATSILAYDSNSLIETVNATGSLVARYTQGQIIDEPLAESRSGTVSFYEQDALGSVTSLTASNGSVAQSYTYDSFGNPTNSSGSVTNFLRYTGREFDTETNLYFYRARYYDPTTARFLSEDPVRFHRGQINFYPYVRNDPTDRTDPLGLFPVIHKLKCWIWGLFCIGPAGSSRLEQLQNPATDYTDPTNHTNDDLSHPGDDERKRFQLCVSGNDNCKEFLKECGDVVLAPIGDGMFPH